MPRRGWSPADARDRLLYAQPPTLLARGVLSRMPDVALCILYLQYTDPSAYPPLQRSAALLSGAGYDVLFLGVKDAGPPSARDERGPCGDGQRCRRRAGRETIRTLLDRERADLVHLHALTRGASLRLAREAKSRGRAGRVDLPHADGLLPAGTLLRWGREVCDGRLDAGLCTRCTLHGLGLPRAVAEVVSRLPAAAGTMAGGMWRSGGLVTALRMWEMLGSRHTTCRALLCEADRVVALCQWAWDLLVLNGVSRGKLILSGQGVNGDSLLPPPTVAGSHRRGSVRMAFLGRLHPTKGAHVLVSAVRHAADLPVTLDVYGIVHGGAGVMYLWRLRELAAGDSRIRFHDAISANQVAACLRDYDALAVPSQWLETGPMVVLEAFAAGTPVLGSRLGGIAELVEHDVNGLLIEAGSAEAWRRELRRLCSDPALLARLRRGVRPPRTMGIVAAEMHELYRAVLRTRSEHPDATMPA